MNKKPKISVILPVYNVEKYLDRCLKTVVQQSLKDIEIIIIDDGSTDNCPKLCDEWAKKDSRIRVIHKKNEGLGMARNTGINNATGKYICFFDSDDYIEKDTLKETYNQIEKNKADICCFGFCKVNSVGKVVQKVIPNMEKNIYIDDEILDDFLPNLISNDPNKKNKNNLIMSAWGALFSLELIKKVNWKFVSERKIISEDVYSLLKLYRYVKKVVIINKTYYYYCTNVNSLTHTFISDRYDRIKTFYNECIELCKKLNYNEIIKDRIKYPFINNSIGALKLIVSSDISVKNQQDEVKKIISDDLLQSVIRNVNLKYENIFRKILFIILKNKMYFLCYLVLKIKVKSETK